MFKSAGISSHIISLQVVFLFLLIPGGIFSQTYNLKKYSINEGLCNSQITCIMQDQRGFLWFGSYGGGISRFDGKEFRNFTEKDGLVHNTIRAMAEDKEGNIWIGTLGGGVCFFDGRNFHSMKDTLTGSSLMIYALMADKDGKIWAGTGSGLYVLDNNHFVRPEISGINENPVMSVIRDSENRLWFTSWDDGVYCVDGDNIIHLTTDDGISFNSVMQIYEAPNGTVWLSTFYGADSIPHFSPGEKPRIKKFTTVKELAGSQIFGILCDRSGNYWFADNKKGVYRITPGTPEKTLHIFSGTGLDSDVSYYLFEDVEGNIWISSWGTGVSMFSSELFVHYSISDGMKNKVVVGVTRYLGKTVMTDTRGVASVENGFPEIIGYEALRRSVYCICTDEDALWMGCNNALGRFMNGRLQFWELSRYSYLGEIKTVCRGKDGKIWMGCWGNGMLEFDGTTFTSMNEKYGLPPETYVYTSYCDRKGNIWFGCWSAGLVKVTNDTLILITDSARTGNPNITGIHEDSDGNILVSSFGGGISIMKNPADSLTERWQINESNGLADNVVHGLVFNADSSMLWVSTQKGLSVIDYGKFMKEGETDARFFGKSEGFVNIEATANASMYCDPEGYIWIGTKYGLTRCNPAAMRFNTIETRTHITGIRLFFEVTDWTVFSDSVSNKTGLPENLVLPWKENHLTFDFIGINSTSPEKVRYRFYLEGLDKDWSPATDRTEATYSSLSPGEYCFKVMAMNNDGVWNHEPACFSFKITPPFWQTTWFYIACSLVILLTFYAIYAVRTRKLKNDKIILEQKVKERTREIQQQKEEITAQRDAIMEQNEEITQQKEDIETQRDEI
ncbi:MAG: two-component regulator propeller domain-containing protein, partial [Bacteroidota bacterium]